MITIEETINLLKKDHNFREIIFQEEYYYHYDKEQVFDELSYDSRQVGASTLFFAKGRQFKKAFLEEAITKGLGFYVSEVDYHLAIPVIMVNDIKQAMSLIAMAFYGYPQNKLKLLAFTGTKGKTTAAYFAYHVLKQHHKPAMLSTMNTTLDGKRFFKSALTTPESIDLFKMMASAVENKMTHLIMEVSSQAYLVKRTYGLTFDVGVFLNISPDHIGPIEHPTFEDYFYHKRLLLDNSRAVVVNSEMSHFSVIKEQIAGQNHLLYGEKSDNRILTSESFTFTTQGLFNQTFDIKLIGRFNQENALAVALACHLLGVNRDDIVKGIAETTVPGRMEILKQTNGASVFVDYAHNGVSLSNLIEVVQKHHTGKISLVLGAPGNKGESRRHDFAEIINQTPDLIPILTADDPNFEDPIAIAQEIAASINRPVTIIADRQEAIKKALSQTTNANDAVILAGKGADCFQIVEGKHSDYPGDFAVAQKYINQKD